MGLSSPELLRSSCGVDSRFFGQTEARNSAEAARSKESLMFLKKASACAFGAVETLKLE